MKKKMIFLLLVLMILMSLANPATAITNDDIPSKDLLLIIENEAEYDTSFFNQNSELTIDIVELDNIKEYNINEYSEIAAPASIGNQIKSDLRKAFADNKKVYLYGELTIDQYEDILNLERYGVNVSIEVNEDATKLKKYKSAFMTFSEDYISDELHNVIALCKNNSNGMLASIQKNEDGQYNLSILLKAVIDEVEPHNVITPSAIPVKSGFDVKAYDYLGNYAILDWHLYQQSDESVDEYDFFAIKSNVAVEGTYFQGQGIWVNYDIPYSADEYISSGPGDSSEETSFSVNLDFGDEVTGGLSWDFSFDNAPEIDSTISLSSDYAHWSCIETWYGLDGEVFSPGMSWASTGSSAVVDITFRGYFYNTQLGEGQYTDWKSVPVRYTY